MHRALPALPLVCPSCRVRTETGLHLFTVSLVAELAVAPDDPDEIEAGLLGCDNPACGRRYPIVDGIPVLTPDPGGPLRGGAVLALDLPPEVLGLLVAGGADDEPLQRLCEHLSMYLDAHYGDQAEPPPDGPGAAWGFQELARRLGGPAGQLGGPRVKLAVELGCGVGRGLRELARGAERVVGVDLHFAALRRARRLLRGGALRYPRRRHGRVYQPAHIPAAAALPGVGLICADALDPPLPPGLCGRAVALNLLDAVTWPAQLLAVLDGLLAPAGELILASPYAWQSGIVAEEGRFSGEDPAAELRRRLRAGEGLGAAYHIEDEAELVWELRRDARSAHRYQVHFVRGRKG